MQVENAETKSNGSREQITENLVETMISFNERLMKAQEEKKEINVVILQSLIDMQQKLNLGSDPNNVGQEGENPELLQWPL